MKKPVLVIMAAGMGSRYGGLKQIDPVDAQGHIIMDFSIYDAKKAGFEKVVFIIKKENEADFREAIGDRVSQYMEVAYVFQELSNIPEGFDVPEGRVKPWGTAHAVFSCLEEVDGPFAVINADDYYGQEAFRLIYDYLASHEDDDKYRYTMVGYKLGNTVTDNGHVSRGVCDMNEKGELVSVHERTRIEKRNGGIAYTEDDGTTWTEVPADTTVSMNMWGLTPDIFGYLAEDFKIFLDENISLPKSEFFLPFEIDALVKKGIKKVHVLSSADRWYGVTYREDKQSVVDAIAEMTAKGMYK